MDAALIIAMLALYVICVRRDLRDHSADHLDYRPYLPTHPGGPL
jgi:hypothetical protein